MLLGGTTRETPVSRGRTIVSSYGIPVDILKWTGAEQEDPEVTETPAKGTVTAAGKG